MSCTCEQKEMEKIITSIGLKKKKMQTIEEVLRSTY